MYIFDTNVVSELRRPDKADRKVMAWANAIPGQLIFVSAITIFELEHGILRLERKDKAGGRVIRTWLDTVIQPRFAGRILPIDDHVAHCCARLHVPTTRAVRDAWIAATAIVHAMTVVTRNVADLKIGGVKVHNPWA